MNLVCDCTVKSQEYSMYADHREQGRWSFFAVHVEICENKAEPQPEEYFDGTYVAEEGYVGILRRS